MEVSSLGGLVVVGDWWGLVAGTGAESKVGDTDFFSSASLFSNPSTLFNKASSTSVLGPLFLGTAS